MSIKKVLVIDDDESFTGMLQLNLESVGNYTVRVENNPLRALQAAKNFMPDVILMDVMMPQKGGPDLAEEIQACESLFDIPIIFLTATITSEEAEAYRQSSIKKHFISKPSHLHDLIASIEEYGASA